MNATGPRILVIEDDPDIRLFLATSLGGAGYEVLSVGKGREGVEMVAEKPPALAILDLGLPDMDGIDVIRRLRAEGDTPVIILSARTDERQKIRALDAGADDYLTKPFGVGELMARVRAALRRAGRDGNASFESDGLLVDLDRRIVTRNGTDVHLTPTESKLLECLLRNRGRVVTHRQLLADVWGADFVEHTHYLRIYMGQLRAKLEADPADPRFILTETGVGYRFAEE
jgi:two-component system, OmpR family, KDP operon response regulator KdpE